MWYDGTEKLDYEKFCTKNRLVVPGLFIDKENKKLTFFNNTFESSPLFRLTDPHRENCNPDFVFYHVFVGSDADIAKEVISEFDKKPNTDEHPTILLARKNGDTYFTYGNGRIVTHLMKDQKKLKALLPEELQRRRTFVVPFNCYYFECPVCHKRTLGRRYLFDICVECGWEDGQSTEADSMFNPNYCSIQDYRKKYVEKKKKDPDWNWLKAHSKA